MAEAPGGCRLAPEEPSERGTDVHPCRPNDDSDLSMSSARRILPALLVFLLGLTVFPAGAASKPGPAEYRLVYAGSGNYAVDLVSPDGLHGHVGADFHWRIAYRPAPLRNGIIEWQAGNATGSGTWSMSSEADNCSDRGALRLLGDGGGLLDLQHGALELLVFPEEGDFSSADGTGGGGPCAPGDFWRQWVVDFSQIGAADYVDPLTAYFEAPRQKLAQKGGIRVQTSNRSPNFPSLVPSSSCGFTQVGECTQSFSWTATVAIKKAK